jgi:hypothetical protein
MPMDAEAIPFPREDRTPPITKTYFAMLPRLYIKLKISREDSS